ncbi:MAG: pyridoxal-dependent decarboxylase [Gemmatimonadota bacterium]
MKEDSPRDAGEPVGDMPPEEFREWGREMVDWIARYLAEVEEYPVLARVRPGEIRSALPAAAPESGEPFDEIFQDFQEVILPGVTHWNHPSFHGFFAVTGSGPGILGELLAAALNVNAMVWRSSPAGTELERLVVDWLRALVGLPDAFSGVILDTASTSSLTALTAARHRAYPGVRETGLFGAKRGRIYASEEAHSSIDKATIVLGFGHDGIRKIPVDAEFRMRPDALRAAILEDLEGGILPVAVVATVGTTSTASPDPVAAIAEVAEEFGLWLHVDAAYAGAAAIVPEIRGHFAGWERANSVVFNPHKWLFTPVDCSVLLTRNPDEVRGSLALTPVYLQTRDGPEATNLMDYGMALGRRFRALKLWFVLRYFGAEGVRERIRHHVRLAQSLAAWVDEDPEWERIAPVVFSTIVFRHAPRGLSGEEEDALNLEIMERVNASGEVFLSQTRLRGRIALRLSIGNLRTRERHLLRTWELLREAAGGGVALAAIGAGRAGTTPP